MKKWIGIIGIILLGAVFAYGLNYGFYGVCSTNGGSVPDLQLNVDEGTCSYTNATPGESFCVRKSFSLTNLFTIGPVVATVSNSAPSGIVDVPIKETCEWIDKGDSYVCERPQIWNTTTKEMWLDAAFDIGGGQIIEKTGEKLLTKALGHAVPGLGLALGIKTAVDIIGALPEVSGQDAYTKLLFMNEGEEINPDTGIPYDEEISLMVFCRPAVGGNGGYAADYVTGLTIEKFNDVTKHWETFQAIELMSQAGGGDQRTHDHLLLAKDPIVFAPGAYQIKVEEVTGFSEETHTFEILSQIKVVPSPEAGGEETIYSNEIGESVYVTATANENWEFVRWSDGETDERRWVFYTSAPTEYVAEFRRTDIPTDGLVAYYPFDGDAQDHSGNGNHGVVHGATLTTGISGQAYLFDGVDYIGLPNFNIFGGSEGWSYSVWINSSEVNNRSTVIDFHGDKKLLLDINNALLNARYKIRNTTDVWRVLEYAISSSDWYSIVHTYSPTKGTELFVNGSSVGTDNVSGDGIDEESTAKNKIGQYFDGSFQFAGKIDQVRIYNRALSAAEISALYQSGQ